MSFRRTPTLLNTPFSVLLLKYEEAQISQYNTASNANMTPGLWLTPDSDCNTTLQSQPKFALLTVGEHLFRG